MAAKEAADKAKKTIEVFRLQSLFKSCCRFEEFVYLNELNGRLPHIATICYFGALKSRGGVMVTWRCRCNLSKLVTFKILCLQKLDWTQLFIHKC